MQESVLQYGARPPGLCTMCFCARAGTCVDELMYASLYICTVRAHQDFVLLCFCIRLHGVRPKMLCAVRAHKGFTQCAGARPPGPCSKCLCARARTCAKEQACTSVPYGASPRGLWAFVYVCTVRDEKGFVRYEPTSALYSVLVLAHQDFVPSVYVLVWARVQMSSCTRTCTYVRDEPTSALCFCAGGCADELICGNLYVCTVRAHKGFMQCVLLSLCLYEVLMWNQYA